MMRLLHGTWATPEPGSDLQEDDAALPDSYASMVSVGKLCSSLEHLQYFFESKCKLAISAPYTVLRTALTAATEAYWVLEPNERVVRLERVLRITVEDMRTFRTVQRGLAKVSAEFAAGLPDLIDVIDRAEVEIERAAGDLGIRSTVLTRRLNMTDLVSEVATALVPDDRRASSAVELVWRSESAHAHAALFTPAFTVGIDDLQHDADGAIRATLRYDPEAYVVSAALVMHIARSTFRLFEERRTGSTAM
jgi:hypothetical protein